MSPTIVARWRTWDSTGLEHLVLTEHEGEFVAASAIIGTADDGQQFAARYTLRCDANRRLRAAHISVVGEDRALKLSSEGKGDWRDGDGTRIAALDGAIDIDISATPFTNTLPIRRLTLAAGASAEIIAAYVRLPDLTVEPDAQRYTCIEPNRRYRYESLDSDFTRDIEVDQHGLVLTYPGLFQRVV